MALKELLLLYPGQVGSEKFLSVVRRHTQPAGSSGLQCKLIIQLLLPLPLLLLLLLLLLSCALLCQPLAAHSA